uniref:Leukocyte-associated immunoglobulin-like receptor 1 n=1 Tax=Rattus norvegicus TaxID=10116 RepID=A0A8I6A3V0_RAT
MPLHSVIVLVLVLCLGWKSNTQEGLPNNKSQHQRSQERLNLATNGLEKTSDIVMDDSLSEDRQTETWTPVAGDLQEVTYAQLDHDSLTQRTVKDVTPQNRVIMAESSTYAAIMRC